MFVVRRIAAGWGWMIMVRWSVFGWIQVQLRGSGNWMRIFIQLNPKNTSGEILTGIGFNESLGVTML